MPQITKVAADGTTVVVELTEEEAAAELGQSTPPTLKERLSAYAVARRDAKLDAGLLFSGLPFPTDERGRAFVNGAYNKAVADNATTKRWQISNSPIAFVTLDAAFLIALGLAFDAYVQSVFDKLDEIATGIEAGAITTTAQIDAAYASVSQVFGA